MPVLLITIVLIPLIPFVFYALNGYLLGQDYFEFAALRRLEPAAGRALRRQHKSRVFVCGTVIAVMTFLRELAYAGSCRGLHGACVRTCPQSHKTV